MFDESDTHAKTIHIRAYDKSHVNPSIQAHTIATKLSHGKLLTDRNF